MRLRSLLSSLLMLPNIVFGEDIAALGFVDDRLRLGFVKTLAGWQPACEMSPGNAAKPASASETCTAQILTQRWRIVDAGGRIVEVSLSDQGESARIADRGLVNFELPPGAELEFDLTAPPRYTWTGPKPPPLLAVSAATEIKKLPRSAKEPPRAVIRQRLVESYLSKPREIIACDPAPEYTVHRRTADASDIVVQTVAVFDDGATFFDVSLNQPEDPDCDILDSEFELMAARGERMVNLSLPFRDDGGAFTTSLSLFEGARISTSKGSEDLYILFIGGYNVDGYALVDSELKMTASSSWGYH